LVGPTGSGKTALAVEVAKHLPIEVVSADSRQVYRRLDVGTAKPTRAERDAVRHHLVDVADPEETYTAARFGYEARSVAGAVRARDRLPALVGGSGLYLRAAEEGLFEGPAADATLRERLTDEAECAGDAALHARLAGVDPEAAARLHVADRVRVIRALEVWELTGKPLSEHHREHRERPPEFRLLRFGIEWPPEVLARRLEERVDAMLAAGWTEEVRDLLASGVEAEAPAMRALGYPEIYAQLAGEYDRTEMRRRIVVATRQFAKRQRTWFRAVEGITWLRPTAGEGWSELSRRIADAVHESAAESG
jgi:tRNA dimethylallyltransferase